MQVMRMAPSGVALCADESGATSEVMVDLVAPVAAGDWVLVHAGAALQRAENAERFRQ
ncbi:MAG: HypC/HybG/HupF family hydrogenase formation chaperone [Gaiellaceae bacterium]